MSLGQREDEEALSSVFYFLYNTEDEEGRAKMFKAGNDVEKGSRYIKEFRIEWHSELNSFNFAGSES